MSSGCSPSPASLSGKSCQSDRDIGAGHAIISMLEYEIGCGHLEFAGGQFGSLADDLACTGGERAAMADERARSETAGSNQRRCVRVTGTQTSPYSDGDAEDIRDKLGEHGLVPLSGPARQGEEIKSAIGIEADGDLFLANATGRLDEYSRNRFRAACRAACASRRRRSKPFQSASSIACASKPGGSPLS